MKTLKTILMLFMLFCACNQGKETGSNQQIMKDSAGALQKSTVAQITSEDTPKSFTFKDDAFITRVLQHDISCAALESIFKPNTTDKKLAITPDDNTKGAFDTVYSYNSGPDTIAYFSSLHNCFATSLYIKTDKLVIDTTIKIGMQEDDLLAKFIPTRQLGYMPGKVTITDVEDGNEFTFVFREKRLFLMQYKVLYID